MPAVYTQQRIMASKQVHVHAGDCWDMRISPMNLERAVLLKQRLNPVLPPLCYATVIIGKEMNQSAEILL
jgi:hypothetical protein